MSAESKKAHNFIQSLIEDAIAKGGEHTGKVVTRFPPRSPMAICTLVMPNRSV